MLDALQQRPYFSSTTFSKVRQTMTTAHDRIAEDIKSNDVVLFMKGTPVFPQCGFSAAVVQILSELGVKFKGIDVLKDAEIRQGIKEFSNWPTIPQLYVKGEFVGGSDIVREMYEKDELKPFFAEKGIALEDA
jgi:monothiol glutaredoxin